MKTAPVMPWRGAAKFKDFMLIGKLTSCEENAFSSLFDTF